MPGELDALHQGIGSLTHYELLGVPTTADRLELRDAHSTLRKRLMSEPLGVGAAVALRAQIGAVVAAVDEAFEVLLDPARRAMYDRMLAVRPQTASHATIPPPAETPTMPAPPGITEALVSLWSAPPKETPRMMPAPGMLQRPREDVKRREAFDLEDHWSLTTEAVPTVEVLPTLSRQLPPTPVSEYRTAPASPTAGHKPMPIPAMDPQRAAKTTGSMLSDTGARVRHSIPPELSTPEGQLEGLRRDYDTLSTAIELCLQELCEARSPRADAMRSTLSALAAIRGTHAATAAHMAEQSGLWALAADQWRRAFEAQPRNAHYALCAARCFLQAGTNLDAAAHFAQLAQELGGGIDTTGIILNEVAHRKSR